MGRSISTDIVYGYVWGDEQDEEFPDEDEWTGAILRARGVVDPWDSAPDYRYGSPEYAMWKETAGVDAWNEANAKVREEFGVDVSLYGTDGWTAPYVYVTELKFHSYDYSKRLDIDLLGKLANLDVEAANAKLQAWLDALGIVIDPTDKYGPGKPGWHMVHFYG